MILPQGFGSLPLTTPGLFERNTHSASRCKHVEQCDIWGNEIHGTYMIVWLCLDERNHL